MRYGGTATHNPGILHSLIEANCFTRLIDVIEIKFRELNCRDQVIY